MASIIKRPDGRWQAQVRRSGLKSVSKTFAAKRDADAWARSIEGKILTGDHAERSRVTIADVISAYEELHAGPGHRAFSRSKAAALKIIGRHMGTQRIADLTATQFRDFVARRERDGAGPATITMDLSYLGTVLRQGGPWTGAKREAKVALGELDDTRLALRHAGRIARPSERDRRPTEAELQKLIAHWSGNKRQIIGLGDVTLFAVATAMRLGEIVGIQWEDVDLEQRTVLIRDRKDPRRKTGNHQRVPLLAGPFVFEKNVIDPLEIALRQDSAKTKKGAVFAYTASSVSTLFTRAVSKLDIIDLHFHDLRHDGVSRMFEAGMGLPEVALVSGHKTWAMLARYTKLDPVNLHKRFAISPSASPDSTPTDAE